MGNRRLHNIECIQTLNMPESERLEVTALNLFHLTTSPLFRKAKVFHITTQSHEEKVFARLINFQVKISVRTQTSSLAR
jgi:hypothetical protein